MSDGEGAVPGRGAMSLRRERRRGGERESAHEPLAGAGKKEDWSGLRAEEVGAGREQQAASNESHRGDFRQHHEV